MAGDLAVELVGDMMGPFKILEINAQGVKMNRLPVTLAEEAMLRRALAVYNDRVIREALESGLNEQQKPVYPSGYRINSAPRSGVSGGKDSLQPGIQVEPEPVRRMGNQGQGKRAEGGKDAGR